MDHRRGCIMQKICLFKVTVPILLPASQSLPFYKQKSRNHMILAKHYESGSLLLESA